MKSNRHDDLVTQQYDSRAQAYLDSAVHAAGTDLDLIERIVGPLPNGVALDMGCGGGHVTFRLAPLVGKVVAYDLSAPMLAVVAEEAAHRGLGNVVTKQGAAEALPCPPASFDVVATRYSAHHWRDMPAGLASMHKVLKRGGLALFSDVIAPNSPLRDTWLQSLELLRDPSHVRNASLSDWRRLLEEVGFTLAEVFTFRLRLEFATWIERMRTPPEHVAAIRALQRCASAEVSDYFAFETDGSFTLDTALIVARRE